MADGVEAIEAKEAEASSWARTGKDLVAGAAGGIAQVLLGELYRGETPIRWTPSLLVALEHLES